MLDIRIQNAKSRIQNGLLELVNHHWLKSVACEPNIITDFEPQFA